MAKKTTYSEQLKSPKWQKKRLEILNLHNFKCDTCGSESEQLHVHHLCYIKDKLAWEYNDSFYSVLCQTCHTNVHNTSKIPVLEIEQNNQKSDKYKDIIECLDKYDDITIEAILTIMYEIEDSDDEYDDFWGLISYYINDDAMKLFLKIIKEEIKKESAHVAIHCLKQDLLKLTCGSTKQI